ncbi:DUF1993 family protein [Sphingosinithalassobacter sp. LHW66-3]|uniref:DUF1993 family protein n=1 Tax=Sphingosinithalassobacter sp. LHW66-3 TaxID=3424718 RepID=UPI003D6AC530
MRRRAGADRGNADDAGRDGSRGDECRRTARSRARSTDGDDLHFESGEAYVRDWALPQFYFHLNTAYAVLRHHGAPLGKVDYVAYALPCLRPGTAPGG